MKVIPRLSSSGFAKSVPDRIDTIFAYYLSMNYSQTVRYKGNVHSLAYAVFRANGDMDKLAELIKVDLVKVLTRNFPEDVLLDVVSVRLENSETYEMQISGSVVENNKRFDISNALTGINSTYVDIFNVELVRT